jgi:hypothetical protein
VSPRYIIFSAAVYFKREALISWPCDRPTPPQVSSVRTGLKLTTRGNEKKTLQHTVLFCSVRSQAVSLTHAGSRVSMLAHANTLVVHAAYGTWRSRQCPPARCLLFAVLRQRMAAVLRELLAPTSGHGGCKFR